MSARAWIVVLLLTAVLAGASGFFLASHRSSAELKGHAASEHSGRKVLYWHDPMRPDVKFDKPGRSPFMDMDLVPVYADEDASAAVRIDPTLRQSLGIRVGNVERRSLPSTLRVVGTVMYDEREIAVVQSRVEGYVEKLYIKAALEHVRKGQPIAAVVAPAWLSAEREYLALLDAQSPQLGKIRSAARERLRVLGIPDETIAQIEREHRTQTTSTLRAPLDGVVSELNVREGAAVMAGTPIARINGMSRVWVNAQIPESDVSELSSGAEVTVRTNAWPGEQFNGHVLGILPQVNEQTRTLAVRIAVQNPERKLSPGMFTTLMFENPSTEPALWVPSEAVIRTGKRDVVIVSREDGGFTPVSVELGAERNGFTAITSGLEDGQSVVLSGQFLIDSESSLRSALARLTGSPRTTKSQTKDEEAQHP